MLLKKVQRKRATKNISIEKLPKKLSLELFVKNSRKNAAKNVPRKNATKNKSIEMLLKTLSLVTFVKKSVVKCCGQVTEKHCY